MRTFGNFHLVEQVASFYRVRDYVAQRAFEGMLVAAEFFKFLFARTPSEFPLLSSAFKQLLSLSFRLQRVDNLFIILA